jgi:DNA-binding transcriptional MerR regulator
MVRKRHRYARARAKRTHPKTAAPTTGWVITELARLTQIPVRRLRYYVQIKLLQSSEFRGTATRYQRLELLRALGIQRLRAERASLLTIKQTLHALGERELEAWLRAGPLPPEAASALGLATDLASAPAINVSARADAMHAAVAPGSSTWQRVTLLPGLELMIATDASPVVQRAARSICAEYVGH